MDGILFIGTFIIGPIIVKRGKSLDKTEAEAKREDSPQNQIKKSKFLLKYPLIVVDKGLAFRGHLLGVIEGSSKGGHSTKFDTPASKQVDTGRSFRKCIASMPRPTLIWYIATRESFD